MERPLDAALAAALIDGWLVAALEQAPAAAARLSAWHVRRKAALDEPACVLTVGHVDLFACPGGGDPVSGDAG
jgi:alkanesulfonate monooxygenase SsuD/methylene tetrahydromethanopterin reductase-like flavin-dependent oxidoreductase (luciferase family)